MFRKMRKIPVLFIALFFSLSGFAQTASDIVNRVKEVRQESGDSIAREYLVTNKSIFKEDVEVATYLTMWGLLTSNMWNAKPSVSLTAEYKQYLESIFDDERKSVKFVPAENALAFFWNVAGDYSSILFNEGKNDDALLICKCLHRWFEAYPEAKKTVGYAQSLYNLCSLTLSMEKYDDLMPLMEEYIEIAKIVYGEKSTQYAQAIYYSGVVPTMPTAERIERIKKAISIYELAEDHEPSFLEEMKTALNVQMVSLTGIANTDNIKASPNGIYEVSDCLALIASDRGAEAIGSLLYHKNELSKSQSFNTVYYSKIISYIVAAYLGMNELAAAQKELEDLNSKVGVDNLPLNYTLNFYSSAGLVAMRLRDYPMALKYLLRALKLSEQISEYDIEYCKLLGNIGITYGELGKSKDFREYLLDAKMYIDEAISVFEDKVGPLADHGATGLLILNNKAYIYDAIGDRDGAMQTYERIVTEFAGNNNVKESWAYAANNLSCLYLYQGKYDQCIKLLQKIETENIELQDGIAQNILLAYYLSGKSGIKSPLVKYDEVCRNKCMNAFEYFSESELENYWTYNARTLMINNAVAEKYPEVADVAYNNALFSKRLTLMSTEIVKDYISSEDNPNLHRLYNKVKDLQHKIKYGNNAEDSLRIWRDELREKEHELILSIPDMKERFLGSFRTCEELKQCLQNDEVAIEFVYSVHFDEANIENWENMKFYYCALILSKDDNVPKFVNIVECNELESQCQLGETDALVISEFYNKSGEGALYEAIWKKLEPYIRDKKTIYFSPTGILNSVNHNAIIVNNKLRMADLYNLVRVSSTSHIITLKKSYNDMLSSATIYGGINYDESVYDMKQMAQYYSMPVDPSEFIALRAEDERGRWNLLTGTKKEIENIDALFKAHNLKPTIYTWNDANEESFKSMDGKSPSILHLSTHGYFIDSKEKLDNNPFIRSLGSTSTKNDMLARTGLLLSGANNVWTGKDKVNGIEDGILTAEEISRLNLKNTNLVVLSACETAKGKIDEIEGVLGLQRAFKIAGAGTIVMSLWKVPDIATSFLMTSFYDNLLQGKDARSALKMAQKKLKEENDAYKDPYYWAAFVVLD